MTRFESSMYGNNTWRRIFFVFLIIIMPDLFTQIKLLSYAYALGQIAIFGYYLFGVKKGRLNKYIVTWFIICFYLLLLMVFYKNLSDIDKWGRLLILVSDVLLVIDVYIRRNKTQELLSAVSSIGVLYFAIQTILLLIFPNGFMQTIGGNYYFLGLRTSIIRFFYPFFTVALLYAYYYKKRTSFVLISFLSVFNFIYFSISTAIVVVMLLVVFFVFRKPLSRMMSFKTGLITATGLSIGFIFFNASTKFGWFIETVLKKDITLTSRTLIWNSAIKQIFSKSVSFLFGNGISNDGNFVYLYNVYWPAHNQLLQWLYEFGLIGLILLLFFFMMLNQYNKNSSKMDVYILTAVCTTMFVAGISSAPFMNYTGYIVLAFLPYLNLMEKDSVAKVR